MGKMNIYGVLLGILEGEWSLGKPNVDRRMVILK